MDKLEKIDLILNVGDSEEKKEFEIADAAARQEISNLNLQVTEIDQAVTNLEEQFNNLPSDGGSTTDSNDCNAMFQNISVYNKIGAIELGTSAAENESKGLFWTGLSKKVKNYIILTLEKDIDNLEHFGFYEPTFSDTSRVSKYDVCHNGVVLSELKAGVYLVEVVNSQFNILEFNKVKDNTITIMTGATSSSNGASGLVPMPEVGSQDKFLKGDGTWGTPDTKVLLTYGESVQVKRTCFAITNEMVDTVESHTDYNEMCQNNNTASLFLYLNGNYTLDADKQYIQLDFMTNILDLSDAVAGYNNFDTSADIIIYNADGSILMDWITIDNVVSEYFENEYDFVDNLTGYYFYKSNNTWNKETNSTTISNLTYNGTSEKGYLYISSKNEAIEKLLENPNIIDEILEKIK